jgi:hypothetical protein
MDCRLKFGCMKKELLVIVYHHDTVDIYLRRVLITRQALKVVFAIS